MFPCKDPDEYDHTLIFLLKAWLCVIYNTFLLARYTTQMLKFNFLFIPN